MNSFVVALSPFGFLQPNFVFLVDLIEFAIFKYMIQERKKGKELCNKLLAVVVLKSR